MASPGTLRNITGYAFEQTPPGGSLRTILGYAFQTTKKSVPIGFTGIAALYQLINSNSTYTSWSASNSTISAPSADSTTTGNTKVTMTALAASGYSGSMSLYYTRRPMADAFNTSVKLPAITSNTTISALLPQINAAYGSNLVAGDIVDGPVQAGAVFIVLTAASTSYMFLPGSQCTVGYTPSLSVATPNTKLAGFTKAGDPNPINATALLLHFDGANGATTTTDAAGHTMTMTASSLTTSTPVFGSAQYQGSSATSQVSTPDATNLQFTGDFTLEFWYTPNASDLANEVMMVSKGKSAVDLLKNAWYVSLGEANVHAINGVAAGLVAGTTYHIAITRSGSTVSVWTNGQLTASATSTLAFGADTSPFIVGGFGSASIGVTGKIDEFRASNICRYLAPFYPSKSAFTLD